MTTANSRPSAAPSPLPGLAAAVIAAGAIVMSLTACAAPWPNPTAWAVGMCALGHVALAVAARRARTKPVAARRAFACGVAATLGAVALAGWSCRLPASAYLVAAEGGLVALAITACIQTARTPRAAGA
jgi:hypothetical protein